MNITGYIPPASTAPPEHAAHPAAILAGRLDSVLGLLLVVVAAYFRLLGALTVPLWNRLSRARLRLVRLLHNLAAGRLPRPYAPGTPRTPSIPPGPTSPAPYIPRGQAWLVKQLGHRAAGVGAQLEHLLRDPDSVALLGQSPGTARTMRRLCRLLGVPIPAALTLPRRPAAPPLPQPARPTRVQPARPLPCHSPSAPIRPNQPSPHRRHFF